MTFNLIVKVSNIARRSLESKLKSLSLGRMYHVPERKVVPIVQVKSAEGFLKSEKGSKVKVCHIHVTSPNRALPPLVVLILRSVAKISVVLSGRYIRKWWQKLSPEEKEKVKAYVRSKQSKIAGVGTIFAGVVLLYYLEHIVVDPITKRRKFIMLNQSQINQVAEFEYQHQLSMFKKDIVPVTHPFYRRVSRVANTLLLSNRDLKEVRDKVWGVTVVDRPDITNAFALPHGQIFVFTGMLHICTNDDQLAIVLAHEISHSILSHVAESISKVFFVEFLLLIPSIVFWSVLSDAWALFSEWITATIARVIIHLPFSRSIEREADVVGLQLAAKSCYDVREAPIFWGKMKLVGNDMPLEWLSTHPSHESRQLELQQLIPLALRIRDSHQCPPLLVKLIRYG